MDNMRGMIKNNKIVKKTLTKKIKKKLWMVEERCMNSDLLKTRREKLKNLLNNGDLVIVFSAEEPTGITNLLQNNNFLYLTGLNEVQEAIYICAKINDTCSEALFIQRNIPERIVWDGEKMYPDEATKLSGIEKVKFLDEFDMDIMGYFYNSSKVFVNYGVTHPKRPLNKGLYFISNVRERFVHLEFAEVNQLMIPLRQIKDHIEIEYMSKAIEITGIGLDSIFKSAKVGMYEYELEAVLFYEMRRRGLTQFGFAPIIATGINATTLHYKKNNSQIMENDLVLCDVGALYNNYSADITRTFPINNKFTHRQKEIYTEVLNCQKTIISLIKPNISMVDLNNKTVELIGESCLKLKLTTDVKDYKKYYMHSIGHHLGMDTHDIGPRNSVLAEGMVITVEPGIYVSEERIGVRIEDDVLVTKEGCKVLSNMIPKEIDELERIRNL